jgi:hypothetical protein
MQVLFVLLSLAVTAYHVPRLPEASLSPLQLHFISALQEDGNSEDYDDSSDKASDLDDDSTKLYFLENSSSSDRKWPAVEGVKYSSDYVDLYSQQTEQNADAEVDAPFLSLADVYFLDFTFNVHEEDTRDIPRDSLEDKGDQQNLGETAFILVTTFDESQENSGSIWAIPNDNVGEAKVLVTGLHQPTGVCFDTNHDFMYVTDSGTGCIYQYEISWSFDSTFKLTTDDYTVVYEGSEPFDCSVDEYGNLYFVDRMQNQVCIMSCLDLWAGFKNQLLVMFDATSQLVSSPVAIDLASSSALYFANNEATGTARAVVKARPLVSSVVFAEAVSLSTSLSGAVGLGASEDLVFFSGTEGSLNVYDIKGKLTYTKASGPNFAGVCYSDGKVYVVDNTHSLVLKFNADTSEEQGTLVLMMPGVFGVHCVNWAGLLRASILGLLLLN